MSKYDFEIDLSENTSTGIILGKITPGSIVLEFGCATGRMTRYMKEKLNCKVYIVEYDRSAYEKAAVYAADGVCGDIMDYTWVEKFGDVKFDAVIFADVLEHLYEPKAVVKKAAGLLKSDGVMLISMPAITHNDILLKLYNDRYDYTPTGILDDTHVYFLGSENIPRFFEESGLYLNEVRATYCLSGYTEQYGNGMPENNILLNNILMERSCGEIYQFIFKLSHDDTGTEYFLRKPVLRGNVYVDYGDDFDSNNIIPVESVFSDGFYSLDVVLDTDGSITRLRFDPVEKQGCIIKNISFTQNGIKLTDIAYNGLSFGDGILFNDTDPMIIVSCLPDKGSVRMCCDIILYGEKFITEMEKLYYTQTERNIRLTDSIRHADEAVRNYASKLDRLKKDNTTLKKENEDNCLKINTLTATVAALETDVGAYNMLVNVKERYIIELENELKKHLTYRVKMFIREIVRKIKPFLKKVLKK